MKKIFSLSNLPVLLLVVYIAKSFIIPPSFFDFGVIFLMSSLFLYTMKLNSSELSDKEDIKDIIAQLEEKVNERMDNIQKDQDSDRLAAESKFSTLNLGMQRKPKQPQEKAPFGWG